MSIDNVGAELIHIHRSSDGVRTELHSVQGNFLFGGLLFTSHWLNLPHWTGFYIAVYGKFSGAKSPRAPVYFFPDSVCSGLSKDAWKKGLHFVVGSSCSKTTVVLLSILSGIFTSSNPDLCYPRQLSYPWPSTDIHQRQERGSHDLSADIGQQVSSAG